MMIMCAFLSGLLFGLGLIISGMADPAKVQGFLDLARPWDPSLAFVMAGAIAVGVIGFAMAKRRQYAFCGAPMMMPTRTDIDKPLLAGALVFGFGWGLAGICPGPGLVLLGAGYAKGAGFVVAMLIGMWLVDSKKTH